MEAEKWAIAEKLVKLREPVPGDWEMLNESHPHKKESSNTAIWRIDIPARSKVSMTYRLRVKL